MAVNEYIRGFGREHVFFKINDRYIFCFHIHCVSVKGLVVVALVLLSSEVKTGRCQVLREKSPLQCGTNVTLISLSTYAIIFNLTHAVLLYSESVSTPLNVPYVSMTFV